jgi:hypothetical protein
MDRNRRFDKRPFTPVIAIAAITAFGFIVMFLWNALMPEIFKLPTINFWQSAGLLLLSRILIGGFGGGPGGRRRDFRGKRREMMHHMRERWEHMTPEQRERFRQSWKKRWDIDLEEEMSKPPQE